MPGEIIFIGKNLATALGWTGSIAYLTGYLLLSMNKLKPGHKAYHALNIGGAIGLTANALFLQDYPNVIVNLSWGLIAIAAIATIVRTKRN
ncbi:hypothetical protein LZZ85_13670 [Terrimonas sp. NA20]|uniref:CBU-0592-like domain-containing protein n=1 Tax=Terrimonas ginsenosidimutans TaxID=2908004 RepID=A0ABS9KSS1_9BACT|nr:hypothetical protein [Terrimonas ginsenosidimutans]MCG2615343.1 hypothetical protein [Terrimonas ginsenosidimutans]